MLTPFQLQEMAVLSRPHSPANEWATAQISEDRRQALAELLIEVVELRKQVAESRCMPVRSLRDRFPCPEPGVSPEDLGLF